MGYTKISWFGIISSIIELFAVFLHFFGQVLSQEVTRAVTVFINRINRKGRIVSKATGFTAVVTAANLNPTIFTQFWLTKFGILKENDFQKPGSLFSPLAVNVNAEGFSLLVVPERIQIGFTSFEFAVKAGQKTLRSTIGKIVKELPHTPFGAVGFNFEWLLIPNKPNEMKRIERNFFLSEYNPLLKEFKGRDSHFGCYLSKDVGWARLKLDIKPITLSKEGAGLQLAFNYNTDLEGENKGKTVCSFLENWDLAFKSSNKLASLLGKGWSK